LSLALGLVLHLLQAVSALLIVKVRGGGKGLFHFFICPAIARSA
jgi:hypothetical protein